MDMFERIRANRIAALAAARQRRETAFNPQRCAPIVDIRFVAEGGERGELTLLLADGREVILPHFYDRHAHRLMALSGEDRIEFLKGIWLNYNAWRSRDHDAQK